MPYMNPMGYNETTPYLLTRSKIEFLKSGDTMFCLTFSLWFVVDDFPSLNNELKTLIVESLARWVGETYHDIRWMVKWSHDVGEMKPMMLVNWSQEPWNPMKIWHVADWGLYYPVVLVIVINLRILRIPMKNNQYNHGKFFRSSIAWCGVSSQQKGQATTIFNCTSIIFHKKNR